jgi:hypothetical protein
VLVHWEQSVDVFQLPVEPLLERKTGPQFSWYVITPSVHAMWAWKPLKPGDGHWGFVLTPKPPASVKYDALLRSEEKDLLEETMLLMQHASLACVPGVLGQ